MANTTSGADKYERADGLWIVTSYFNPAGFISKRENYELFIAPLLRSGIPVLTVECAFSGQSFTIDKATAILRVRADAVMWQKERLLNIAIEHLPRSCTKVAWIDCDVLFSNPRWAAETANLLDRCAVVQPFKWVVRLPRGRRVDRGDGLTWKSFGAVQKKDTKTLRSGRFDAHGHTGFAWAAQRDVLDGIGLYDACIAGSGDHMIAHAALGDTTSRCIYRIIGERNAHTAFFERWAGEFARRVSGRIGYTPGTLLHLWHGDIENRRYVDRNRELADMAFDPCADLTVEASGVWAWKRERSELQRWAEAYFHSRKEDGEVLSMIDRAEELCP
jgi:hypothetical protein